MIKKSKHTPTTFRNLFFDPSDKPYFFKSIYLFLGSQIETIKAGI